MENGKVWNSFEEAVADIKEGATLAVGDLVYVVFQKRQLQHYNKREQKI